MIPEKHPVQRPRSSNKQLAVPKEIALAAYEVYSHVFSPQEALINDHCRGGFGVSELVVFLYLRSLPKDQWREKLDELFRGMENW